MKTSPCNADTAAICFLIPKEVHITGAPLYVTLNVDCTGYSWTCTEHSEIVRICFAFSVFLSYSQAAVYTLSVCPFPVHLCLLECTHNN